MDNFIIYTYGGQGELVAQIFNGIARIFGTNSEYFTVVGKFAMSLGAIWAATRAIFNTNIGMFGKEWFFPVFLSFTFLFTPKSNVLIIDQASNHQYSVDNIPVAIALFSSLPSGLSHYLAYEIEEEMKIAGSSKSSKNGLMFGAKLLSKLKNIKVQDPMLLNNAKEFNKQCFIRPWIMGNLLGKRQEAETTKDIIGFLRENKAKHFGFYKKNESGESEFKPCAIATDEILNQIEKEAKSLGLLGNLGLALGGTEKTQEELARRVVETGNDALKKLSYESQDIHNWVKQSMMLNIYRESLDDWREGVGFQRIWPELLSMNATRGMYQQSIGWMIAGEMASEFLPLLQTIVFLLVISSIFIVFPMSMLPGGYEILKIWIKSMIWVHTWPIFFAIINCLSMSILSLRVSSMKAGFGMDKLTQGGFSDMLIHSYSITQMIGASIPIFSWMLISKSGHAFSNMVERMSPLSSAASIGSSTVDNTLNMDNISMGNRQYSQSSLGPNLDMSSTLNTGAMRVIQSSDGREFLQENQSKLLNNLAGNMALTNSLRNSYSNQASNMQNLQTRKSSLLSRQESQTWDLVDAWREGADMSKAENQNISEHMNRVAQYRQALSETDSNRKDKSTGSTKNLGVDVSLGLPMVSLGGKLSASGGIHINNTETVGHEHSKISSEEYQKSLSAVQAFSKSHEIKDSSGKTSSASNTLNNTMNEIEQVSRDISSTAQTMQSIQREISNAESYGTTMNQNLNDEVLDKVRRDNGFVSKNEAAEYLNAHPKEIYEIAKQLNEKNYGNSIKNSILSEGSNLNRNVNNQISGEEINYKQEKDNIEKDFKEKNSNNENYNSLKNIVESNLDQEKLESSNRQANLAQKENNKDFQSLKSNIDIDNIEEKINKKD